MKIQVTLKDGTKIIREESEQEKQDRIGASSPDSARTLSRKQFAFLLKLTGFGKVWDSLIEAAEAGRDMATAAALEGERASEVFRLDRTLQLVAHMGPQAALIAPDVNLSEAAIRDAWAAAETWKGLGNG